MKRSQNQTNVKDNSEHKKPRTREEHAYSPPPPATTQEQQDTIHSPIPEQPDSQPVELIDLEAESEAIASEFSIQVQTEIRRNWNKFLHEIAQLKPEQLPEHTVKKLQARYDLANNHFLISPPRLTSTLKGDTPLAKPKKASGFPNKYTQAPLTTAHGRASGAFRKNVLPSPKSNDEPMALAQYATVVNVPFTNTPVRNEYTFPRVKEYETHKSRQLYLQKYYLPVVLNTKKSARQNEEAIKALLYLFSHMVKESLITKTSKVLLLTMINYELKKLNILPLNTPLQKKFYSLFGSINKEVKDTVVTSKYSIDPSRKLPIRPPIQDREGNYRHRENGIQLIWLKRGPTAEKHQQIDEVNYPIIRENTNVYDLDTGELVASFRKKVVPDDAIEGMNKYAMNATWYNLQSCGAQGVEDRIERKAKNQRRTACRSAALGILGLPIQNVTISHYTGLDNYNTQIVTYAGAVLNALEATYKEVAAKEYTYCKRVMKPLEEYRIFPGSDVTCAIEFNYDKQTFTHTDENQFPGKYLGFLSCFYGSKEKRYKGGYTAFPEYQIAFDVEQGDCLIANFEEVIHANTKIIPLDTPTEFEITRRGKHTIPNWHRMTLVAYTRGHLLEKTERFSYENSDTEEEQDFNAQVVAEEIENPRVAQERARIAPTPFSFFMKSATIEASSRARQNDEEIATSLYEQRNQLIPHQ